MAGEPVAPGGGDAAAPRPSSADRHVARLAAEGRERQAAALAAEAAEQRRIEREERRRLERLLRPNVRASLLDSPRGTVPPLRTLCGGTALVGMVLLMASGDGTPRGGVLSAAGLGLLALACGGYFPARWMVGQRLERVERAWVRSLPFGVGGYFPVLSATPSEETRLHLRIAFRERVPERDVLDGVLGRVQFPASARLTGGKGTVWTAESGPIRTVFIEDGTPSNAMSLAWMRAVIDEALLPLHEAYPLREVEFRA